MSVHIERSAGDVYAFAAEPLNMPQWAAGIGDGIESEDGRWFVATPEGRAEVRFSPPNEFGILDHSVLTPSGEVVQVPLRVVADGDGSEVVFTVRRAEWMTDADLDGDAARVAADLATLKEILERS